MGLFDRADLYNSEPQKEPDWTASVVKDCWNNCALVNAHQEPGSDHGSAYTPVAKNGEALETAKIPEWAKGIVPEVLSGGLAGAGVVCMFNPQTRLIGAYFFLNGAFKLKEQLHSNHPELFK